MMFKKPAGVLMFLLVILKVLGTAATPHGCHCSPSSFPSSCLCFHFVISHVPQDMPTTITRLTIISSTIRIISQSDFSRYRRLEKLDVSRNSRLFMIDGPAFYHQSNLKELDLSKNNLTFHRSDMFTGLGNVEKLRLQQNHIIVIQAGTFNPTSKLRELYLSYNRIASLRSGMFAGLGNLQDLWLQDNEISDIQAGTFNPTPQLRNLVLYNNKLTHLRADMFLGLGNLEGLWLNNNNISDIQVGTFSPMPQLDGLFLMYNLIQSIPSNFLANLLQLTRLRFDNNNITTFPFEDLSRHEKLKIFHLDNNELTTLPSMAYDILTTISDVNIGNNPWQCDCRMVGFRLKMTGIYPFENQTICFQPEHLHGQKLIFVSPEDLMSDCEDPIIVRFERGDNMTLYHGDTLYLVCKSTGIPTPDITVILPSGLNVTVDSVGRVTVYVNGTVIVRHVTTADAGLYICVAENPIGSTSATLLVYLQAVPTTVFTSQVTLPPITVATNSPEPSTVQNSSITSSPVSGVFSPSKQSDPALTLFLLGLHFLVLCLVQ